MVELQEDWTGVLHLQLLSVVSPEFPMKHIFYNYKCALKGKEGGRARQSPNNLMSMWTKSNEGKIAQYQVMHLPLTYK